jgi:hypothetical protein
MAAELDTYMHFLFYDIYVTGSVIREHCTRNHTRLH